MQSFFSNQAADISLDQENNVIVAKWKFAMDTPAWTAANEALIQAFEDHDTIFQLSDVTESSIISQEQQEIIKNDIQYRLYNAGLRYTAMVIPHKIFVELSASKLVSNLQSGLVVKQFKGFESAYAWFGTLKDQDTILV